MVVDPSPSSPLKHLVETDDLLYLRAVTATKASKLDKVVVCDVTLDVMDSRQIRRRIP
jgi:hypothetical protein